ncbi:hypothetical protein Tco_0305525 [Tanacetum coccineum]
MKSINKFANESANESEVNSFNFLTLKDLNDPMMKRGNTSNVEGNRRVASDDCNITVEDEAATIATQIGDNVTFEGNVHNSQNGEDFTSVLETSPVLRRSSKQRNLPSKLNDFVVGNIVRYGIEKYVKALNIEMEALHRNNTYVLTDLPPGRKVIRSFAKSHLTMQKSLSKSFRHQGDICFIKDEGGRTITDEEEIKKRWGEYFSSLFNPREPEEREEVKMGRNKAVGPDQIPIKAWKILGGEGISWLTSLFNKIFMSAKMPEEWRLSDVIPIFKNKGDAVFPSGSRLHQGSEISPYLFALILDELSRGIQEDIPWEALEDNDLRVSREKTEYLRWDFGNIEIAHNEEICIGDKILQPKESFSYLGSMMHKSERIDEDVAHLIKATWLKWRAATRILYDRNVTLKMKGKFYRVAIRPAMLYGLECWPITKALDNKMEVAELRMLRWMCGKTMLDMIPNGVYRAELEVDSIINKMR